MDVNNRYSDGRKLSFESPLPRLREQSQAGFTLGARTLPDPLLSISDITELLGTGSPGEAETAVNQLEEQGVLESSTSTQRPFDPVDVKLVRLKGRDFSRLVLTALEAQLADGASRYQFTCDGRLVRSIAEVDRLNAESATGQQRAEIRKHVDEIAKGVQSGTEIPNSILLTLIDEKVIRIDDGGEGEDDIPESWTLIRPISEWQTVPSPDDPEEAVQQLRLVEIDFPFRRAAFDEEKTALLVDGQQRTAALAQVSIDSRPQVDLSVNAVITGIDAAKVVFGVAINTLLTRKCGQNVATDGSSGRALHAV